MMRILLMSFLFTLSSGFAQELSLDKAKELLARKNVSLSKLNASGAKVLLGEGSGAGLVAPYQKIMVVFTKDQAILKQEILETEFSGTPMLKNLVSLEAPGTMVFKDQVKGVILK